MAKKKQQGESVAGYFRRLFQEQPAWLEEKKNDELLARYRQDHNMAPEEPVEKRVKDAMANTKSQMRKQHRQADTAAGPGRRKVPAMNRSAQGTAAAPARIETLEEQIDDALTLARHLDREGLGEVINLLRRARNQVVWKMGQP